MTLRIIICTTDQTAWETVRQAIGRGTARVERVDRLEDAVKFGGPGAEVHVAVVDDRFLSILSWVERALRRYSPAFRNTVVTTIGEVLTAQWIGLLDEGFEPETLLNWMDRERKAPPPSAGWQ